MPLQPENSSVLRSQSSLVKPRPHQDCADLGVEGVDVVNVELVGDVGVAFGCCGVLFGFWFGGGEGVGEVFCFALECVEVVEDGEALGEDGFAAEGEAVLQEVAEGHAFDASELAVVEGFDAGEDFRSVDFPVPLPPTRPVRSSGVMSQLASSKRSFWPKRLPAEESWSMLFYFLIDLA